jgi:hypothetical protein
LAQNRKKLFFAQKIRAASDTITQNMERISDESRSHEQALYYQASEQIGAGLFLWLPLLGIFGAITLGGIYAFFEYLVGEVLDERDWVFWMPFVFALALALTANLICRLGKVRRGRLRKPIALLVAALGLYASWHIYILFANDLHIFDTEPSWLMSPLSLVRRILELARYRGWSSWLEWTAEAATIYLMCSYLIGELDSKLPFCEHCKGWAEDTFSHEFDDENIWTAVEQLKAGHIEALANLRPRRASRDSYALARVLRCPCFQSWYLCLDSAKIKSGTKGSLHFSPNAIGAKPSWHYHFGSAQSTDFKPVITNLYLNNQMQQTLSALKLSLIKPK